VAEAPKSHFLPPELHQYVVLHGTKPDPVRRELIEETAALGGIAIMQIAPEQGAFMELFTRAIGARRAIEVGTFTGYSALCIAHGLPEDGRLLCCDVSREWTAIARRAWDKAGVADRIELRIAPALETLRSLPEEPAWDLAFLDADKTGYEAYYEEILPRLRSGGVILVDNVFMMGRVVSPDADDENTAAIRAFNAARVADDRVDVAMIPLGDGLSLLRKR
jgi:caffeoyl-CoA O-methyltransferase